jgi:YVTN family beta-propeller protein
MSGGSTIARPKARISSAATLLLVVSLFAPNLRAQATGNPVGSKSIDVPGEISAVAMGEDSVWVVAGDSVSRIDPQTNRVVATIAVKKGPNGAAVGYGSVWVTSAGEDAGTLSRIDPATSSVVATIPVIPGASGLAVGEGAVWVFDIWSVSRIDPQTNLVVRTISFEPGHGVFTAIAVGEGYVWLVNRLPGNGEVARIDPGTNEIVATIPVGDYTIDGAVSEGSLWVVNAAPGSGGPGTVSRIDLKTNQVVATITVGRYPVKVVVGGGAIWVSNIADGTISQIEPQTNRVVKTIPIDDEQRVLAYGKGSLWFATPYDEAVTRIDPGALMQMRAASPSLTCQPAPALTPLPSSSSRNGLSRPILYFDVEGEGERKRLVTKGVFSDGRQLGILAQSSGAVWSPDGMWFAVSEDGKSLRVRNVHGEGRTVFTAGDGEHILDPLIWSPDGKSIALQVKKESDAPTPTGSSVIVIDVNGMKFRSRYSLPEATFRDFFMPPNKFRWSPDGRKILLSSGVAVVIDTDSNKVAQLSTKPILAEWAPSSDAIYYLDVVRGTHGNRLAGFYIERLGSGPIQFTDMKQIREMGLRPSALVFGQIVLSPSASKLVIAGGSRRKDVSHLFIYEMKKGVVVRLSQAIQHCETEGVMTALEWSPDENSIAVVSVRDTVRIRLLTLTTGEWKTLATVPLNLASTEELDVLGLKTLSWTQ